MRIKPDYCNSGTSIAVLFFSLYDDDLYMFPLSFLRTNPKTDDITINIFHWEF